ncbi:restriction endonuclease subunit S [Bacillus altitudinis]
MKKIIDNLPSGWSEKKLKDNSLFLRRGKSPEYCDENQGLVVINQDCIRWDHIDLNKVKFHVVPNRLEEDFYLRYDDILINSTGTGTIGRVNQWSYRDIQAVADSHVTLLRVKKDSIDPKYARYFLSSELGQRYLESVCFTGSTNQIELSKRYLSKMNIPCAPLPEQKAIAGILFKVDKAIEAVEKSMKAAENLKRSLMQNFLTGKLKPDGTWRSEEEMFMTKYGFAPKSWRYCQIKDLIKDEYIIGVQDGNHGESHPVSSEFVEEGIPFVMASDISEGFIDIKNCKKISKDRADKLRIGFAKTGDVLLSHKASVGYTCIVENADPYVMLTPQVTYYRVDPRKLIPEYLKLFFQTYSFQCIFEGLAKQSTRNYMGITNQKKMWIYLPDNVKEQQQVVVPIIQVDNQILNKKSKIQALQTLKKSLVQNLLTGRIRADVEMVNKMLKEV